MRARAISAALALMLGACVSSASSDTPSAAARDTSSAERLVFIGQDLGAVREYYASGCCGAPDGVTTYLSFYDLRDPNRGFGGLGWDLAGSPLDLETSWGAGPVSAEKSAREFGADDLAIGLFIGENEHPGGLDALVSGAYDENIRHLARFMRSVDGVVFLRIGYEFDGAWNRGYEDRARFVRAWRRIVDLTRGQGVTNVRFVWQAGASPIDDIIEGRHENIEDWYPGDEYVDWIALSWFLNPDLIGANADRARTPAARRLAEEVVVFARQRGKLVMIAEAAPQGYDLARGTRANISPLWDGAAGADSQERTADQIWSEWYAPFFAFLNDNADVVRSIAYINCRWDEQPMWGPPYENGYWGDTRLHANAEIARRWNAAVTAWRQTP